MENSDKIAYQNNPLATTKHRKVYKSEFKAKVALEAVRGKLTINQTAKQFEVHRIKSPNGKNSFWNLCRRFLIIQIKRAEKFLSSFYFFGRFKLPDFTGDGANHCIALFAAEGLGKHRQI